MAGLVRSPLVLARNSLRASSVRACQPALARTFLINVKPTGSKSKKLDQNSKAASEASPSSSSPSTATAAFTESSESLSSSSSQNSANDPFRIETTPPAVVAFAHRLGLGNLNDQTLIMRIVTHPSYERVGVPTNHGLDVLGAKVLNMYVMEHFHTRFPKLPSNMLEEIVQVYTRPATLELMAKEFGVDDVARWVRSKPDAGHQLSTRTVKASVVRAVVGALHADQGPLRARQFVHDHFLSRDFDYESLAEWQEPKRYVSFLMKRLGRERPVARLMSETGRTSKSPVFIVGVYSGTEKIGEGFGSSLKMAEFRANKNILTKYYFEEIKDFGLPSDCDKDGAIYIPTKIGDTQVVV